MAIGFVGTGTIAEALVTGLSLNGDGPEIWLSPRNQTRAQALSQRFANVRVGRSNEEVLERCETLFLCVRPQVGEAVLRDLRFRAEQAVISVIAGYPLERVQALVEPARRLWRAVPLPAAARRSGPLAVFPPAGAMAPLLARLGTVIEVEQEDHLSAIGTATSTMAAYFGFAGTVADWLSEQGLGPQARRYVALVLADLAQTALAEDAMSFEELSTAHSTPGGLNEQLLREWRAGGALEQLRSAMDRVGRRSAGRT